MQPIRTLKRRGETSQAIVLISALLLIAGCRDTVVTEPEPAPTNSGPVAPATPHYRGMLHIEGSMGPQYQSIYITRNSVLVTDAEVTVNGFRLTHCCGSNFYTGTLPESVPAGGKLNLKVVAGEVTFEAAGQAIATPIITLPAAGSTFASTDQVNLAWSSTTDPDEFRVCLNCWENSPDRVSYTTSGSTRAFTIVPGDLADYIPEGTVVAVYAHKHYFLNSVDTPDVSSNVGFSATSRDLQLNIKH